MMQTPRSSPSCPLASSSPKEQHTPRSVSSTLSSSPISRLWRPASQRNLRNQWSRLAACKSSWISASLNGRLRATSLVNAYLSERYVPEIDLGVLRTMPDIHMKACLKLSRQQVLYGEELLSSYRDMVSVISEMVKACKSMRCFQSTICSPLINFTSKLEDTNDPGDGGGISVFTFMSIQSHEELAKEFVEMFGLELIVKRSLVVELLSFICKDAKNGQSHRTVWSDELYPGEFDELHASNLFSEETCEPFFPKLHGWGLTNRYTPNHNRLPQRELLELYLTLWLVEVNIDNNRVERIFGIISNEIGTKIS